MKLTKTTRVTGVIIFTFISAMIFSFIPDQFPAFFGDEFCTGNYDNTFKWCKYGWHYTHGQTFHWGYRYFIWFSMGFYLFIVQCVKISNIVDEKK
jgi:hypothetical protein